MGGSPRGPPAAAERKTRRLAQVALAALSIVLLLTSVVFLDRQSGLEGALQAVTPFLKELYDSRNQVLRLEARVVQLLEQVANLTTARDEAVQLVRDGAAELPGLKDDLHRLQRTLAEKEEELVQARAKHLEWQETEALRQQKIHFKVLFDQQDKQNEELKLRLEQSEAALRSLRQPGGRGSGQALPSSPSQDLNLVSDPGFTLSDDLVQVHEEHVLKEAQAPTGPVAPRD